MLLGNDKEYDARLLEKLNSAANRITTDCGNRIQPLNLHHDFIPGRKNYHASELLGYHDRDFVTNCYLAVCGRKPHEFELSGHLAKLRGGQISKTDLLRRLVADEGRKNDIHIVGLKPSAISRIAQIPIVGYVVRVFTGLARLPVMMKHQQQFEAYALGQQQQIIDYVNDVTDGVWQQSVDAVGIGDLTEAITILFDAMADLSGKVDEIYAKRIESAMENIRNSIEELRTLQQTTATNQQEFLIQEQAAIVATQKMVTTRIEDQMNELAQTLQRVTSALGAQEHTLQSRADSEGTVSDRS